MKSGGGKVTNVLSNVANAMTCPLMQRLAGLGIPTLVVAQYEFYVWENAEFAAEQRRISKAVLRCAADAGLATLDLFEATEQAVRTLGRDALYRTWHRAGGLPVVRPADRGRAGTLSLFPRTRCR